MSVQDAKNEVRPEILNAFDIMWGLHPSPVLLVRANRDIVAVNKAGKSLGITPGIKCFQLSGKDKVCDGCRANSALKDHIAERTGAWQTKMNMFVDSFWIPVQGEEGLYVHFGNNITPHVKEALCR